MSGISTSNIDATYCPACGRAFHNIWMPWETTGGAPLCQQPTSQDVVFPGCLMRRDADPSHIVARPATEPRHD